ncbi:hypothetical protein M422DRAFT_257078 [Sphaerobolus stellatus SS14]|uniref:Uncharacterized protein n=1 Tax=Sphaerobolus stellatus (strain SS14) TaxID=990650 RepID=A0A0C9UA60_SPHS4|nr:hypothetical protein M422DRAFT_257078 [Sphaerobolus stellatus SS14]
MPVTCHRSTKVSTKVRPPGFQEQREKYWRLVKKTFGKDHLGEDKVSSGLVGDEEEADASGEEESEVKYPDETLGQNDDVVEEQGLAPKDVELSEESEMGVEGEQSGEESEEPETASKKATPKAKVTAPNIMESKELSEQLWVMSGDDHKFPPGIIFKTNNHPETFPSGNRQPSFPLGFPQQHVHRLLWPESGRLGWRQWVPYGRELHRF